MCRTLSIYQPYPNNIETWMRQREELKVMYFLSGLNTHYSAPNDQNFGRHRSFESKFRLFKAIYDSCLEVLENSAMMSNTHPSSNSREQRVVGCGGGRNNSRKEERLLSFAR